MVRNKIILGSKSPRRKNLLSEMGFDFSIQDIDIDESFPIDLDPMEVAKYIASKKALHLVDVLENDEILICADTTVIHKHKVLGKPINADDAFRMLKELSGNTHSVVSGVAVFTATERITFHDITEVTFDIISDSEIQFYIDNFKPYDKAGSYGIQEWIGYNFITEIKGSYNNVVGLPTQKLYKVLADLVQ
jgi:septum formation protein